MVSGRFSGHHPFPPGQAFCCAWSAPSSLLWPRRFGDALVSSHSPSSWHHPPKKTDFYGKSIVNPQGNLMSDESTYNLLVIYLFIFCWDDKKNCGQLAIYRWFTSWISRFSVAMLDYQRVYPIFRHTQLVYPAQQKSFLLGSIFPPIFWGPRSICGPRSILGIHSSRVSTCFNFPAEFSMYIYISIIYRCRKVAWRSWTNEQRVFWPLHLWVRDGFGHSTLPGTPVKPSQRLECRAFLRPTGWWSVGGLTTGVSRMVVDMEASYFQVSNWSELIDF